MCYPGVTPDQRRDQTTMGKTLTAQAVQKLKCDGDQRREVPDGAAPGLFLVIQPSGKKSWALRFRRPGDRRPAKLVLGTVNVDTSTDDGEPVIGGYLTLPEARQLVAKLRRQIVQGKDPAAENQSQKRSIAQSTGNSFDAAASDFILQHAKRKTRRWQEQAKLLGLVENSDGDLELADGGLAKRWRERQVGDIDSDEIFRLIEECRHKGIPGLVRKNRDASEPRARAMFSVLSKMYSWLGE